MSFQFKLAQLYILLAPFITAFSVAPWFPLPLLYMVSVSIYLILVRRLKIFKEDLELILMVILGIICMFFALDKLGAKNLNHTCAISTCIFSFYIGFKSLINKLKSINTLASSFAFSLAFVSIFIIIEFTLSNYLSITISDFIPYNTRLEEATLMGSIIRPRGLAVEAGHMATFYELALPLSFIYLKDKPLPILVSYYFLVLSGYTLLFSSASFAALLLAILMSAVVRVRSKSSIVLVIGIVMITFITLSSDDIRPYFDETVGAKSQILLAPSERTNSEMSVEDRSNKYQNIYDLFLAAPFGIGWGTASQMAVDNEVFEGVMMPKDGGFISLYGEILIASGVPGLLLFLIFIIKKIIHLFRLSSLESQLVLIAVLSLSIHYLFISNYWFPMLWLSLVLADHVYKNEKLIM